MVFYLKIITKIILSLIILNDSSLEYGNKKVRKPFLFRAISMKLQKLKIFGLKLITTLLIIKILSFKNANYDNLSLIS